MVDVSADDISEVRVALTELAGPGAPPMVNGELLFEFPWQSRAFGMARVLCEAGIFHWDEFRRLLITNIREWGGRPLDAHLCLLRYFLADLDDVVGREKFMSRCGTR